MNDDYILVKSLTTLRRACAALEDADALYLDTETTSLNPRTGRLVAVQVMREGEPPVIVDMRRADERWYAALGDLLGGVQCVGHNLSFDWQYLAHRGVTLGSVFDTQVAEQIIHSCGPKGITLAHLTEQYCETAMSKETREWFFDLDQREEDWSSPFPTEVITYMARDLLYLPTIVQAQLAALRREHMVPVAKLEMRVLPAIARMELNGVHIDAGAWRAVLVEQHEEARRLEGECVKIFGPHIVAERVADYDQLMPAWRAWDDEREDNLKRARADWELDHEGVKWGEYKKRVSLEWLSTHPAPTKPHLDESLPNVGSAQQLTQALARMGVRIKQCDEETLTKLAPAHPEVRKLLAWRKAKKIETTYGEKLLGRIEGDGRVHPGVNQLGAQTGRMSGHHPNWQNIPARTEVGKKLRAAVTAEEGHLLLTADFSVIELRILADISKDRNMLDMFASGMDLHTYTARKMFDLPDSMTDGEVKEHRLASGLKARDIAKTINYGVAYGQSAAGFAAKFNVDVATAQTFIDKWYEAYPRARRWLDKAGDIAVERGYSRTVLGRKRYYDIPRLSKHPDWEERREHRKAVGSVRRQGMNHPIQGTCADLVKLAVALLHEESPGEADARLVAVVHDELVVEVKADGAEWAARLLADCMEAAAREYLRDVTVPRAEVHISDRWEK